MQLDTKQERLRKYSNESTAYDTLYNRLTIIQHKDRTFDLDLRL